MSTLDFADAPRQLGTRRAAQYLRMSTERQEYSLPMQELAIQQYAEEHHLQVVRSYIDQGKSGLSLHRRSGIIQLLTDIRTGNTDYEIVLVYDVSRWGRFQDTDEAAYYEYLCRQSGMRVEYCAEPFNNDGGPLATVLKAIKRAMAAEYSRELAVKVAEAHRQGAQAGFHQGGKPGYGLRRMLLDVTGKPRRILPAGLQKSTKEERVVLVPGSKRELHIIRRIFGLYVLENLTAPKIAAQLNLSNRSREATPVWNAARVRFVLSNERYLGIYVYRRTSSRLSSGEYRIGKRNNPPDYWVRSAMRFDAIVTAEQFHTGRKIAGRFGVRYATADQLLEPLKKLLQRYGRLDTNLINQESGMPSAPAYHRHFGSLRNAYALIGYESPKDWGGLPASRNRLSIVNEFVARLRSVLDARAGVGQWDRHGRVLRLDDRLSIAVIAASCSVVPSTGELRWKAQSGRKEHPGLTIIIRLELSGGLRDFICIPAQVANRYVRRAISDSICAPYRLSSFEEVATVILLKANNPETV